MQIDQSSFFLPGNIHARTAVIRVTSAEAAGQMVDPEAIRRLRRALAFILPLVLDFSGWRRSRRSATAWPAAAVAEVMAVVVQRYVGWPVAYTAYRPAEVAEDAENAPKSRQAQGTAVFQTTDEQVGLAAGQAGFAIVRALVEDVEGPELRRVVRAAAEAVAARASVRSTTQRCRPSLSLLSRPRRAMRGVTLRFRHSLRQR